MVNYIATEKYNRNWKCHCCGKSIPAGEDVIFPIISPFQKYHSKCHNLQARWYDDEDYKYHTVSYFKKVMREEGEEI